MNVPWGLVLLVVCPLAQLPVLVYLSRRVASEDSPPPSLHGHAAPIEAEETDRASDEARADSTAPSGSRSADRSVDAIPARSVTTCPECGADNDRTYRYCRGCAERL